MIAQVGGVFLYATDPASLADWYTDHFGLEYEFADPGKNYGLTFHYLEPKSGRKRYLVFSINQAKEARPADKGKPFVLNLRVVDLDAAVTKLREKGVEVRGVEVHPEGKFAWVQDPEGNHLELWEDA